MTEFASNWALLLGSLVFAAPVIFMRIKDHVQRGDIVFSDATLADVLPEGHAEKAPPLRPSELNHPAKVSYLVGTVMMMDDGQKGGTNLRATAWEFFKVVGSLNTMDISVMIKHAFTFV